MRLQRIAVAIALSAVAVIGLTGQTAAPDGADIGRVDDQGVWLTYGPFWKYQQQVAFNDLKKAKREYERCLDPGRNGRNARQVGDLLNGRYRGRGSYAPDPEEIERNREQCGKGPPGEEMASQFYLAEVNWNGSQYEFKRLVTRIGFRSLDDTLVLAATASPGKCLAIYNAAANIVPVRSAGDPDPYGFKNPYGPQTNPVNIAQAKLDRINAKIEATQSQAQTAQAQLASLSNFNGRTGQCTTPARAALPPRPNVMADAEIEKQAAGACVDILMRRHDRSKVIGAIQSVRWDWMIPAYERYKAHPAACADYMPSQVEDQVLKGICAFTSMGCYGQMQEMIRQCSANNTESCRAPLSRWEARVSSINNAPLEARQTCDATQSTLAKAQSDLVRLEQQQEAAQQALTRVQAAPPENRAMSLTHARCGA